jgi:PAS domain S-box-containing protein
MDYIEKSYLSSISEAVYRIDDKLLLTLLDGALNLQDIVYLEVDERAGQRKFITGRGNAHMRKDSHRQFPLQIELPNGNIFPLGQLHVYACYKGVYQRLWSQATIILLTNIAKTCIAGIFFFFIFQSCLSRHLIRIASQVNDMDPESKDRTFAISLARRPPKPGKEDELDLLVKNINSMWIKLFDEIESRKTSEQQLKESEERYRLIMDASPDPIISYDMEGKVTFINPSFTKVFGWTYEEALAQKIDYQPTDTLSLVELIHTSAAEEKTFYRFNTMRYTKDKELIKVDLSCGLWKDETGTPGGIVVILRDMTEQKNLENQLQKAQRLEAIGTLAGGIAHDFNNILAIILGQAELMKMADPNPQSRNNARINEMIKAANRAKSLINQILSISRQDISSKGPVNLVPLIKETIKFIHASAPVGIKIRSNIKVDKAIVISDTSYMHQVLLNLVTNAVQAIKKEDGLITIGLEKIMLNGTSAHQYVDLVPGPYIKLTVSDSGSGISKEHQEKIFDPYFTTKGESGGTGLGLSVVHGIIKNQKGHISVTSNIGQGTTFCILLPRSEETVPEHHDQDDRSIEQGTGSILLVEDNLQLLNTGTAILKKLGYQVLSCDNPLMALSTFTKHPEKFDLVLTDYSMPKLNGQALRQELIKVKPDIKVVLCSGFGDNISEESAKEEGFCAFLSKPYEIRLLASVIHACLKK